jgi:hypothetical protein
MFRVIIRSSSGGQIVYIQHLVSSLCVGERVGRAVHRTFLNLCTARPPRSPIESDDTKCCIYIQFDLLMRSILLLETCREMQYYVNKEILCVKLVSGK